jgi:hypothetical protein
MKEKYYRYLESEDCDDRLELISWLAFTEKSKSAPPLLAQPLCSLYAILHRIHPFRAH